MRIIIAGDPDSVWTKTYIENVLLNKGHEIVVLGHPEGTFDAFYAAHGIRIIDNMHNNPRKRLAVLYYKYIWTIREIRKLGKIDIFHLHYVTSYPLRLLGLIRRNCKRIVVSYWGSDLLRATEAENKKKRKHLRYVDCITVCTTHMKQAFEKIYGGLYADKLNVIDFGINTYKSIDEYNRRTNAVRTYNYPEKPEVMIMVGYNGSEEQQHIRVLEQLNLLPLDLQNRIRVVIPLTYGLGKQSYLEEIKKTIETGGHYQYQILSNFMSPDEMAALYAGTDIMIHAQTTDALSGTVQELLYAGVLVLNPKWLTYREMEERNVYYLVYSDFEEMREQLKSVLGIGCSRENIEKIENNKERLRAYSGWEALIPKWEKAYESE